MATYHITSHCKITGRVEEHTRKRIDAVKLLFLRLAYEAIRANAGLDTKYGWQSIRYAESWEEGQGLDIYDRVLCFWRTA